MQGINYKKTLKIRTALCVSLRGHTLDRALGNIIFTVDCKIWSHKDTGLIILFIILHIFANVMLMHISTILFRKRDGAPSDLDDSSIRSVRYTVYRSKYTPLSRDLTLPEDRRVYQCALSHSEN